MSDIYSNYWDLILWTLIPSAGRFIFLMKNEPPKNIETNLEYDVILKYMLVATRINRENGQTMSSKIGNLFKEIDVVDIDDTTIKVADTSKIIFLLPCVCDQSIKKLFNINLANQFYMFMYQKSYPDFVCLMKSIEKEISTFEVEKYSIELLSYVLTSYFLYDDKRTNDLKNNYKKYSLISSEIKYPEIKYPGINTFEVKHTIILREFIDKIDVVLKKITEKFNDHQKNKRYTFLLSLKTHLQIQPKDLFQNLTIKMFPLME